VTRHLLACSLVALSVACGDSSGGAAPADGLDPAARGLCDAIDLAAAGDVPAADAAFQDRVHQYLHDLADRLAAFDREASGDLLEAKQRVEAGLAEGGTVGEVHGSMTALYRELVVAAAAAGLAAPPCQGAKAP